MQANLRRCLDLIGSIEAGYVNNPRDPGGPTNHGITQRTLAAWRGCSEATTADVEALSIGEAQDIITEQYAVPVRFDALRAGIDYAVLDCSVNSGPGRAVKLLQQVLGLNGRDVDGVLGLHTMAKLDAVDDTAGLILSYCSARLAFMQSLRAWPSFANGWTRRVQGVQAAATAMAAGTDNSMLPVHTLISNPEQTAKATGPTKILASINGRAAVSSVAGGLIFAGGLATQLNSVLLPYSSIQAVAYLLLVCSVLSSTVPLGLALRKAASGEASV